MAPGLGQVDGTAFLAILWIAASALAIALFAVALWKGGWGLLPGFISSNLAGVAAAQTVIQIRGGQMTISRGAVSPMAKEHLQSLVQQFGISCGTVAVTPKRRVILTGIPKPAHQPIRNILLNM